ncbi:unnamed protein product, partial [Rotaria sordida]
MASTTT